MSIKNRLSYTVDGACEVTGMNRNQFYKAITAGELTTFKVGRRRMVSAKALEDFINKLEQEGARKAA